MEKEEVFHFHSPLYDEGKVTVVGIVRDSRLLFGISRASKRDAHKRFNRKAGNKRCKDRINSGDITLSLDISNIQGILREKDENGKKREVTRLQRINRVFINMAEMLSFCTLMDLGLVPPKKEEVAVEAVAAL
jgi:hypothetical protein